MKKAFVNILMIANLAATAYLGYKVLPHDWTTDQPEPKLITAVTMNEPVVMQTEGGLLEVSYVNATEHFTKTVNHTILGVQVGTTIAQISVPATYRYHIELAREWKMMKRDSLLIVVAPQVKSSLPVAFNTAGIQAQANGIWSSVTGQALLSQLTKAITPALNERSTQKQYLELQREYSRKTVKQFVNKWVMSDTKWKNEGVTEVRVLFADEPIDRIRGAIGL